MTNEKNKKNVKKEDIFGLENLSNPFAKKGDRLFKPHNKLKGSTGFSSTQVNRLSWMINAYIEAGSILVENALGGTLGEEALIFPILSCYRQGIELRMKEIIEEYGAFIEESIKIEELGHDLWKIWQKCRKVIEAGIGSFDTDNLEKITAVEQLIKDFHDLDQSGQALRYSKDRKGKGFSFPAGSYDLENIKKSIKRVDLFLQISIDMLDQAAGTVFF